MSSFLPTTLFLIFGFFIKHFSSVLALFNNRAKGGSAKPLPAPEKQAVDCPYEYILNIYGHHHFKKIIAFLDPNLEKNDPQKHTLILDILDAVHFGAILVDDVADGSTLRKGQPAAHHIYGSAETVNRAYLVIYEATLKIQQQRPEMMPFLTECVTQIHKGQDIALVWRRDGFELPYNVEDALKAYRHSAWLKTGALFMLVGQLITLSHDKDDLMSDYGWYCQLQNDCKNVFSSDVVSAKGALAEDLINGEYSYPILVGLYAAKPVSKPIADVFNRKDKSKSASNKALNRACNALQSEEVRSVCLRELEEIRARNQQFSLLWGRSEKMKLSAN
ncbi:terpenoid synthase [Amniculicola lignicola CBS 123094]|uniref:geranylgeranyl diphosphate synthase n=1 Tax=Amniculicola lignicola CBS 123094 TaxID=1392246 RepID=A0A6A5W3E5_9PLEO|nr:terpenoid synthase [Amniculicola lignicola CBS 123094]